MENPEEILHCLEEFAKTKPKDIPRELEEYLCFVAKTGDPVYQWSAIKSLFREKMINVITDFYETCPSVEIPPCPNVDLFNYDVMKSFILEKLDTFAAAPFTLQRICELLTTPRKEYNRIDKYMRALEKNILVVSTTEPGGRRSTENGEGIMNGLESEHLPETSNSSNDINVEEMDDSPAWPRLLQNENGSYQNDNSSNNDTQNQQTVQETVVTASKLPEVVCSSSQDSVITCRSSEVEEPYVSIEPVLSNTCTRPDPDESDVSVTLKQEQDTADTVVSSADPKDTISPDHSDIISETLKESVAKPEEETSSSQQIEDADSSSSTEDDKESVESKEEKILEILPDDAAPENELSSTEPEPEEKITNEGEVGTSQEESVEEKLEEITVDTTKCSNITPPPPLNEEASPLEDLEITSSEKFEEAHSCEAEAKVETASDDNEKESQDEQVEEVKEETSPMEVDGTSEKVEEVVRAEATSDSPL